MKNLILIIAVCLSGFSTQAQFDLTATGEFQPATVQVGSMSEFVVSITNFSLMAPFIVPANGSSVFVIMGAGAEVSASNPPVGPDANKFTWTFLGPTIGWSGECTEEFPLGDLFEVRFPVTAVPVNGVDVSANASTYDANIAPPNSDVQPSNDTGSATLVITALLPVELTSFEVESKDCKTAMLTWETAQEINNAGFHIQRHIAGSDNFETVGFVRASDSGKSGASYSYIDDISEIKDLTETVYYRLRQVDLDGAEEYSDIVKTDLDCRVGLTVAGYPNPVINQYNLQVTGDAGSNKVVIMNEQNQVVENFTAQRNVEYPIKMNAYQSGVYTVTVLDQAGNVVESKKVIKITN